jgi:hypothetical protein
MKGYNNLGFASDVLPQSARTYLIDYYEENKNIREKNYNLQNTWQALLDYSDDMQVEMQARVQLAAETVMRMKLLPCEIGKIVEYVKGSWAQGHNDQVVSSNCSVITMLDLSQDLIGGEAYFAKNKESMEYHKMVPGPLSNGDSLMYGGEMWHGVEEVISGRRLVLVTWFKEDL